jgi:hypothetical protein
MKTLKPTETQNVEFQQSAPMERWNFNAEAQRRRETQSDGKGVLACMKMK